MRIIKLSVEPNNYFLAISNIPTITIICKTITTDFNDLLIAQKRVIEGGPSSKAISKTGKKKPTQKPEGEEE